MVNVTILPISTNPTTTTSHLISLVTNPIMTFCYANPDTGLGHAQKCGMANWISNSNTDVENYMEEKVTSLTILKILFNFNAKMHAVIYFNILLTTQSIIHQNV